MFFIRHSWCLCLLFGLWIQHAQAQKESNGKVVNYPWPYYPASNPSSLKDGIYVQIIAFRNGTPAAEIPKIAAIEVDKETALLRARFSSGIFKGQLMSLGKYCVIGGKPYYGVGFTYVPMHRDKNGFYFRAKRGLISAEDKEFQKQLESIFPIVGVVNTVIDVARTKEDQKLHETSPDKPVATSQNRSDFSGIVRFILDLRTGDLVPESDWSKHLEEISTQPKPAIGLFSPKKSFPDTRFYLISGADTLAVSLKGKSKVLVPLTNPFEEYTITGVGIDPLLHFAKTGTTFIQATHQDDKIILEKLDEATGIKIWRKISDPDLGE